MKIAVAGDSAGEDLAKIQSEIGKTIVGQEDVVLGVLTLLLA